MMMVMTMNVLFSFYFQMPSIYDWLAGSFACLLFVDAKTQRNNNLVIIRLPLLFLYKSNSKNKEKRTRWMNDEDGYEDAGRIRKALCSSLIYLIYLQLARWCRFVFTTLSVQPPLYTTMYIYKYINKANFE